MNKTKIKVDSMLLLGFVAGVAGGGNAFIANGGGGGPIK